MHGVRGSRSPSTKPAGHHPASGDPAGQNAPGAHGVHPSAPAWPANEPAAQAVHTVAPAPEKYPALQIRHGVAGLWSWSLKPARHAVQPALPLAPYDPGRHAWHPAAPLPLKLPAPQSLHTASPFAAASWPGGHPVQAVAPGSAATVPGWHGTQGVAALWSSSKWPGAHGTHAVAPLALCVPGAHTTPAVVALPSWS